MTIATLEPEAPTVLATLFVPLVPSPRCFDTQLEADQWGRWVWRVATFRDFRKVRPIERPCRIVATVSTDPRIEPDARRLARWRHGVRDAVFRTGIVQPSLLRDAEAVHRPLVGVPVLEMGPRIGTEITFYLDEPEDQP